MLLIGQDRILRFGCLSSVRGTPLRLNGKGNELCPFCFVCGTIILQPNELVLASFSGALIVEDQDDRTVAFELVGKPDHISALVGQGEVRGDISNTRTAAGSNVSNGRYGSWCVSAARSQE